MRCQKCGNTETFIYRAQCDAFVVCSLGGRMTDDAPQWVYDDHGFDLCDPETEELPIGCPVCRTWGEDNFEEETAMKGAQGKLP